MATKSGNEVAEKITPKPSLQRVISSESSNGTISTIEESSSDYTSVSWPPHIEAFSIPPYVGWQADGSLDPIFHAWAVPFACQDQPGDLAVADLDDRSLAPLEPNTVFNSSTNELMKIHLESTAARKERRREQNRKAQQAYRARKEQQVLNLQMLLVQASEVCRKQAAEATTLREALTKLRKERASLLSNPEDENQEGSPHATGREFLQLAERLLQLHRQKQLD